MGTPARARARPLAGLGPSGKRGRRAGRAREADAGAAAELGCERKLGSGHARLKGQQAENEREKKRLKEIPFFSKFSKAILQKILKFFLSFQMEHIIQNIMQQHECSIM
jgi:hypothetical protein